MLEKVASVSVESVALTVMMGELASGRKLRESLRIGLGTFLGILAGGAIRFAVALTMAGLTLWWIWS